jgi:hypothetical protein
VESGVLSNPCCRNHLDECVRCRTIALFFPLRQKRPNLATNYAVAMVSKAIQSRAGAAYFCIEFTVPSNIWLTPWILRSFLLRPKVRSDGPVEALVPDSFGGSLLLCCNCVDRNCVINDIDLVQETLHQLCCLHVAPTCKVCLVIFRAHQQSQHLLTCTDIQRNDAQRCSVQLPKTLQSSTSPACNFGA